MKRPPTIEDVERAAAKMLNKGIAPKGMMFALVTLNTCEYCGQRFKPGERIGQLPMVEGGPSRWHLRCARKSRKRA